MRAMDPVEVELKFQVPAAARAAVRKAVATASARSVRLQAVYLDTADQRLAAAGLALRLRKEGPRWVQTLKGRGDGLMQRLEHEVALPPQRGRPQPDPARHAGTAVGAQLAALLADGTPLQERYGTDIQRLLRRVRTGGATVELAFDSGHITAAGLRQPVCEVEFELVAGPPQPLLGLAERWVQRHGLWLDVRTKSERGHRLALGLHEVPATVAAPVVLRATHTPGQALGAVLQAALLQVLPNAAELGNGSGTPEHLHQLRVGLRRLRSALRLFASWAGDADAARALEQAWRGPFRQLGALRDADVVAQLLLQAGAIAGAPPPTVAAAADDAARRACGDAAAVVQDPEFSVLVLRSLRLALDASMPPAPEPRTQARSPADAAARLLRPAWRRARKAGLAVTAASPEQRHRLRRQLKRLRYALEFLQPLLRRKSAARALQALRAALDALGASNDALLAQAQLQVAVEAGTADAGTWWALGWLAARQDGLQRRAARRLARLPAAWPRAKSLSADR